MEIDEDDEPYWYLLNCVAGLEMDLLRQVRQLAEERLPKKDVVKFVVPTEVKTRSHGANRMVRETKVKYLGYVFAKLRLTKETYEPIKKMDLCRSWMGTINMKGYSKLPPAPLPLSEEEIENFDLENPKWEIDEQNAVAETDDSIIVDTHENDVKEMEEEEAIEMEVKKIYKGLKVEDMIKVTAKNKFHGEDGIVKRLKENMVKIRFFTYGQTFDEWLDPSDVRKLTDDEVLKGLGGPGAPITQQDLDGPRDRGDKPQRKFDARNSVGAFGGGPQRDRRQDRNARSFQGDNEMDDRKERENWNWYKENEKRSEGGGYNDGNDVEFRAQSESKRGGKNKDNFWAEGDVDSQWGRNNNRGQKKQQEDDWSSFISQGPSDNKTKGRGTPSKEETDDFFASLMTDLSKDIDGNKGSGFGRRSQPQDSSSSSSDSDDDFFASLMSEIDDAPSEQKEQISSDDDGDDFFASLEREIRGSDNKPTKQQSKASSNTAPAAEEDDFFASLEMELATDLGEVKESKSEPKTNDFFSDDDFFSDLEAELNQDDTPARATKASSKPKKKQAEAPPAAAAASGSFDAASLKKRTVPELKEILRDRGLKVSGKKDELIERITSAS